MTETLKTDVFICGGGPTGLLLAYMLARQKVSTFLVEKDDKEKQPLYGRACTIYPRTLEIMEHLSLLDTMNQMGFVARNSVTFKNGERVTSRGWHKIFDHMGSTYLDYCLNLRQKHSENLFRDAYKLLGGKPYIGWELQSFHVHHDSEDDYKVVVQIRNVQTDEFTTVRAKYLVGADGDRSIVRRFAGIPFHGTTLTQFRWVRIDGDFETNMPDSDVGFASIESKNHGNVLWVQLEQGEKRIEFGLTDELVAKYGQSFNIEAAKQEAIKAIEPFTLKFNSVNWWTVYCIQQGIAETFIAKDRILLAGDASHIHWSGAAQGMNTGVQDAYNLSWKLSGMVKGWYNKEVLQTYDSERRATAQHMLELDKIFTIAIFGHIPEKYKAVFKDANEFLSKLIEETAKFNLGLGIQYNENIINKPPSTGMISAGSRAPDALVYAPGSHFPIRLFKLMKLLDRWTIILFTGQYEVTAPKLPGVGKQLLDIMQHLLPSGMIQPITIVASSMAAVHPSNLPKTAGWVYYDQDRSAHLAYSISPSAGAVVVIRPDGVLGYATTLDDVSSVAAFLSNVLPAHRR